MTDRPTTRPTIAVAGGTGLVGSNLVAQLRRAGYHVTAVSRGEGVDIVDGAGLASVLRGVEVVVDATSTTETDETKARAFFETATRNLLAAGQAVGVRHHIVLSIVGVNRVFGNAHYEGKRAQERLVSNGSLPWTILRSTQFFEFPEMVMRWTRRGTQVSIAPLLVQPIAAGDVATALARIVVAGRPVGIREVAGPERLDLVDMARRVLGARGDTTTLLVPSWDDGPFSPEMSGNVLLPGPDAAIGETIFDDWLANVATRHA